MKDFIHLLGEFLGPEYLVSQNTHEGQPIVIIQKGFSYVSFAPAFATGPGKVSAKIAKQYAEIAKDSFKKHEGAE